MSSMFINKSGKPFDVYNSLGDKIGEIYNREVFTIVGSEGRSYAIEFLGPNGQIQLGEFQDLGMDSSALTAIEECPYKTEYINGTKYKVFKFRRSEKIYLPNAKYWGDVASGMYVACQNSTCGQNYHDWKLIDYVMRSTDNQWIRVEGDNANGVHYDYGFVDTGLSKGSMYNTISMYGDY